MPAGVKGFVPGRLTMAREARALRQNELAELVDRSTATISKYESEGGVQRPDPTVLPRLAEALDVKVSWFFKPYSPRKGTTVFYRSLRGELAQMRNKARARLGFVEAIEEAVSDYIEFPEVDIPDLLDGRDFRELRGDDFEHYASLLRDHWELGDGPIDDLLLVIENAGVIVAEDEIGSVKLDGVSWWSPGSGRPYMLLARDKFAGVRRRLDAAHELAHIVLHQRVTSDELEVHFNLIEEQAKSFAGALMLPGEPFMDEIYSHSLDALLTLKEKWKVSVGAMIKRLSNLEKISPEYERRLWQYYSYKKWRQWEPLDDELPVEQPQSLRDAIELLEISRREFINQVGLAEDDVCQLTGLPKDYFKPAPENLTRLKPKRKGADDHHLTDRAGNIVPFSGSRK